MKECLLMTVLLLTAAALVGKSQAQNTTNNSTQHSKNVTITGCLTRGPHEEYELVDQKGIHNLIYKSEKINLDSYVGQSVTLVGERSAMPSTEAGMPRAMPHFKVRELQAAAGKCGK